jgi:hypothetical protein
MSRGIDLAKAEAALKRAAQKAVHGTREERSGRFLLKDKYRPTQSDSHRPAPKRERSTRKT